MSLMRIVLLLISCSVIVSCGSESGGAGTKTDQLKFVEAELRNTTIYNIFPTNLTANPIWELEILNFDGQNGFTVSGVNGIFLESGAFSVTNGVLGLLLEGESVTESIKIESYDQNLNARVTCWDNNTIPLFNCTVSDFEYMFTTLDAASNYMNSTTPQ